MFFTCKQSGNWKRHQSAECFDIYDQQRRSHVGQHDSSVSFPTFALIFIQIQLDLIWLPFCLFVCHSSQLLKDPQVIFAAYKQPHPLEHKFILRIQTTPDYSPESALTNAITDLMSELSLLEERFKVNHFTDCCFHWIQFFNLIFLF